MTRTGEWARTGVFGGTFNPIHIGHLRAAEEALELLGLERMVFVPSAVPPHKRAEDEVIAPAGDRMSWVRAAIASNERFCADDLELLREGPSYAVDTLRELSARTDPDKPVFLIGHEAFAEIGTWREPETVLGLAHFAVVQRPGAGERFRGGLEDWLPPELAVLFELASDGRSARHRSAGTWIRRIEIAALNVSATDVRARLRDGRSIRYLIPEETWETVMRSGIYGREAAG